MRWLSHRKTGAHIRALPGERTARSAANEGPEAGPRQMNRHRIERALPAPEDAG